MDGVVVWNGSMETASAKAAQRKPPPRRPPSIGDKPRNFTERVVELLKAFPGLSYAEIRVACHLGRQQTNSAVSVLLKQGRIVAQRVGHGRDSRRFFLSVSE